MSKSAKRQGLPKLPPGYSLHGTKRSGFHVRYDGKYVEELCEERGNHFAKAEVACAIAWGHWREYNASSEWVAFVDEFNERGGHYSDGTLGRPRHT